MKLTEQQNLVLHHIQGHLIVLAGPGSGKTHVLTEKILYIFRREIIPEPYGLLAVTFTHSAINEIKQRLRQNNFQHHNRLRLDTFHGFAMYLLRCYGSDVGVSEDFTIIEPNIRLKFFQQMIEKYNSQLSSYNFRDYIDSFKRQGIYPENSDKFQLPGEKRFLIAYREYQEYLKSLNCLDFSDIIYYALKLMKESKLVHKLFTNYFRYIIVDEFQDSNNQQSELVEILAESAIGSTIVGDDDQSIYAFNGANRDNIHKIKNKLRAMQIHLPENFRSPIAIVEASQSFIKAESERIDKVIYSNSDERGILCKAEFVSSEEESIQIAHWIQILFEQKNVVNLGRIAVITRNRNRAKEIIKIFDNQEISWFDKSRLGYEDTWDVNIVLEIFQLFCELDSTDNLYNLMNSIDK